MRLANHCRGNPAMIQKRGPGRPRGSKTRTRRKPEIRATLPESGYVNAADVRAFLRDVDKSTLWRLCKNGQFPQPDLFIGRNRLWRAATLRAFERGEWKPRA